MRRYTSAMRISPFLPLSITLVLLALPPAFTAQKRGEDAIEVDSTKFKPLKEILAYARRLVPGKVIDVELELDVDIDDEHPDTHWVYEIEVLTPDNRVVELEFDAITGQLVEIEGAPWPTGVPRAKR
jgi:hypothetical protein